MEIKISRRSPLLWVTVFSLVIITTIFYSFHTGRSMAGRYAPLMGAAEGIKYETTAAHLWFEEIISGDPYLEIGKIWMHLKQAEWYAQAMLEGGERKGIIIVALEERELREGIKETLESLRFFKSIARERWEKSSQSVVGSSRDQHFDRTFNKVLMSVDLVEATLQQTMKEKLHRFRLTQIILIASISLFAIFIGVVLQYHERRRSNDMLRLQEKEKEQRDILDFMVNAIISINEKGDVLSFNKAAEQLFGYSFEELKGKNIKQVMPDAVASKHDEYLQNYVETGDAHVIGIGREVEGKRKNNDIFPMRLLIAKLPNDKAGKQRFIGSCQDLTKIKQQQEQLRRSQKMEAMGKLTGGIAHDYNNLLGIIMGYAEQLSEQFSHDSMQGKYTRSIQRAAERGSKLTQKLLAFTRHKVSDANVVNINQPLEEQRLMLEKILTARITLTLDLAENLWSAWLDSDDLEDTIINMSINAMHAINGTGQLTLCTCNEQLNEIDAQQLHLQAGDYILLSISDTGSGMDEITREKIFDPFFSTKGERGTGLGLSQVYGFVERSGGAIRVFSELDHGSRFVLYFPRNHRADNVACSRADTDIKNQNLGGSETLLIVDDEPALVELAQGILDKQGYKILTACDGEQALWVLAREKIDLVFSDVIMPNMDGFQLAAQMQKNYPNVKIQMVSGFTYDPGKQVANEIWHQNLLYKPYTAQTLLTRVRRVLDEANANIA